MDLKAKIKILEIELAEARKKAAKKDYEPLKITMREGQNPREEHPKDWTELLLRLSEIQVAAMAAGVKTGLKHFIALQKELEYHVGFRYEKVEPGDVDPRKG